jgi:hypothetical protein
LSLRDMLGEQDLIIDVTCEDNDLTCEDSDLTCEDGDLTP